MWSALKLRLSVTQCALRRHQQSFFLSHCVPEYHISFLGIKRKFQYVPAAIIVAKFGGSESCVAIDSAVSEVVAMLISLTQPSADVDGC